MSFLGAARAARTFRISLLVSVLILSGAFLLSCGSNTHTTAGRSHNAYISLPAKGAIRLLQINGSTGAITASSQTPQVQGTSPTGLALHPSKKFLYAANSLSNSISTFNVASDGSLTLTSNPIPAGAGPDAAVVDPSGKYLLVSNNLSNDITVFSIDSGTGALTQTATVPANANPTAILFTHSGKFVYVANPGIGLVSGFSFSDGTLTQLQWSPFIAGAGASALAVDGSDRFLYVTNSSAFNPLLSTNGNISGFTIDPNTGKLTTILGSPFTSTVGNNPTAITVDPSGKFVYAVTPGSSYSIWCFAITPATGVLTPVTNSPFSVGAGGQFVLIDPTGNYMYIGNNAGTGVAGYTYNPSTGAPTVITGSPFNTGAPGAMGLSE